MTSPSLFAKLLDISACRNCLDDGFCGGQILRACPAELSAVLDEHPTVLRGSGTHALTDNGLIEGFVIRARAASHVELVGVYIICLI